jgi:hypothetical protein
MATQRLTVVPGRPGLLAWDGTTRVFVGAGEHYGALVNRAFDYRRYLDALAAEGLDHIRLLLGTYHELPGQFNIDGNTLAPDAGDLCLAWRRDADGRFDLAALDPTHGERLAGILAAATERSIAVGLCLFCPCYSDEQWQVHPFNPRNNRQHAGCEPDGSPTPRGRMLAAADLRLWQTRLLDGVLPIASAAGCTYIELCNEPYVGATTRADRAALAAWQGWLADEVRQRAPDLPIAMNLGNRAVAVPDDLPDAVGIVSVHYPAPEAAWLNRGCGVAMAGDETGFQGQDDTVYRRQAWEFLLAGGALFSHLDYSFTVAEPAGRSAITARTPGWGGPNLRRQLALLRRVLAGCDRARMRPWPELIDIALPEGVRAVALGIPGESALVHLAGWPGGGPRLGLDEGAWELRWIDPAGCTVSEPVVLHARGFATPLPAPPAHSPGADLAIDLRAIA